MNNTIWKYPLNVADQQKLELPKGAEILCVQTQNGVPCLWAKVNASEPKETRIFETCGTGHVIDSPVHKYIGTYQLNNGSLVFHVFEDLTPW